MVKGAGYPQHLLDLWDAFDEEKGSENDRPDSALFEGNEDQKFICLVFGNGGTDLEATSLASASKGLAVFNQIVHALAGIY